MPVPLRHLFLAISLSLPLLAAAQTTPPALPSIEQPTFQRDTVDIRRLGAVADGQTINTTTITQAIEQCSRNGGGTVLIPRGLWLTGPLVLKSHVNLHLATGALLQFTSDRSAYPLVRTTWEGRDAIRCQAPLSATDAESIAITGNGVIDGAGDAWRMVKKSKLTADQWKKRIASGGVVNAKGDVWYPSAQSLGGATEAESGQANTSLNPADFADTKDFLRPNLLSLTRCRRVLLDGVTFQNSPAWCLHPLLCQEVTLRNLTVRNPWHAQNGDGLDLESCRNSLVDNCIFDVGDDGICLKSGRDEDGRKRGVPTENVLVSNCRVYHAHGGFVIGSEMSGGVRNVLVKNCTFIGTDVGLRFKTARGRGGVVENIYVDGVDMTDIAGEAILFDMYYMAKDPVPQQGESNELPEIAAQPLSDGTPRFRQFTVRNVTCRGAETAILIRGLPEMAVSDIRIEDAVLQSHKGLVCIEAERINLSRVSLLCDAKPVMQFQNSRHVTLDTIQYPAATDLLTTVTGNRSADIRLLRTDTSKARQEISLGSTVTAGSYLHK